MHRARGRRQRAPAGVFETLAGFEYGLCTNDTGAADFLHPANLVGDLPVARDQLHSFPAVVFDGDRVRPQKAAFLRIGLVGQKHRKRAHPNAACDLFVNRHTTGIPIIYQ